MNLLFTLLILFFCDAGNIENLSTEKVKTEVEAWVTSPSSNVLFQKQNISLNFGNSVNQHPTITVDATQTFQSIDGFGNCLTGGIVFDYKMVQSVR